MRRERFRFSHRSGDRYYWISELPLPGDSRHTEIICRVRWYWGRDHGRRVLTHPPDRAP